MTTHLLFNSLKDAVDVCATISEDENPFIVDGRSSLSKLSVADGAKTKATKAGLLQTLMQTLMGQPSLQENCDSYSGRYSQSYIS